MKAFIKSLKVVVLLGMTLILVGCGTPKEDNITIQDFKEVGAVYDTKEAAIANNVGDTRETALAPLWFKSNGTMYTRNDFRTVDKIRKGELPVPQTYYTDLTTLNTVTHFWYTTPEYAVYVTGASENDAQYVLDHLGED